jgi:uncharacterized Fe-S cluster-containing radical SAM superfamily protein
MLWGEVVWGGLAKVSLGIVAFSNCRYIFSLASPHNMTNEREVLPKLLWLSISPVIKLEIYSSGEVEVIECSHVSRIIELSHASTFSIMTHGVHLGSRHALPNT